MAKTTIGNQASQALSPAQEDLTAAMTPEEREEQLQERENALAAREARLAALEDRVLSSLDKLERAATGKPSEEDIAELPKIEYDAQGREIPRLDLTMSYGVVIGDPVAGYVQNGHRFTSDRKYICDEPKGTGKPFNIKMLGLIKAPAKAA
jgi:hypothetical protein